MIFGPSDTTALKTCMSLSWKYLHGLRNAFNNKCPNLCANWYYTLYLNKLHPNQAYLKKHKHTLNIFIGMTGISF